MKAAAKRGKTTERNLFAEIAEGLGEEILVGIPQFCGGSGQSPRKQENGQRRE